MKAPLGDDAPSGLDTALAGVGDGLGSPFELVWASAHARTNEFTQCKIIRSESDLGEGEAIVITLELERVIRRPVQAVWDFFSDFEAMPSWQPEFRELVQQTPGPVGVGTVFRYRRKVPFGEQKGTMETDWHVTIYPHRVYTTKPRLLSHRPAPP
jgi:hypothetical protein